MLKQMFVQRALQVSALALMALTTACGTSLASPTGSATDTTTNTTAVVTPTPTPTPAANVPAPTPLVGEAAVADNFDAAPGLEPAQGPELISGDPVGAFRMFCSSGQILRDDPLVYPGQPGASHLHQFFGNTGANASSTYQSLRTSGGTTCGQGPFNRSAYWFPAMLDGVGHVVKPTYLNLYYKRNPISDPDCSLSNPEHVGQCVDLPNGIRFVFGYNMKDGSHAIGNVNNDEHWAIHYGCWDSEDGTVSRGNATDNYWTISDVAAAGCPVGARLMIFVNAPNCWDGQNIDSADHRSHIAWANGPMYPGQFFRACPTDHPYLFPDMEVQIAFQVDANLAKWHLSSDEMVAGAANGSTFHMDYWEAWSPTAKGTWHTNCINRHLSCSNGGLGDGTEIKGAGVPWGGWPIPPLVPIP